MKTFFLFFWALLISQIDINGQVVNISWIYSYGGSLNEYPGSIASKSDGQIILFGTEESNNGDISNHIGTVGAGNLWLLNLDSIGVLQTETSRGGTSSEFGKCLMLKNDLNFAIGGVTSSNDGDVIGNHPWSGNPSVPTQDYWVLELDSVGGILWQRCYGGGNEDELNGIIATLDNGYLLTGTTKSNDGDVSCQYFIDIWVVKTDSVGNIEWTQCYGGILEDEGISCCQLSDSSYLITGYSVTNFGNAHGASDVVVSKIDKSGNALWIKCYGGTGLDNAVKIISSELDFYVVANTNSDDGDVDGFMGYEDIWIFKGDSAGNILWQKCYGGSSIDMAYGCSATLDGGLVFTGFSISNDSVFVTGNQGHYDAWAAKIDSTGNLLWGKSIGGSLEEVGTDIIELDNNHVLITGYTKSSNGDMPTNNHGNKDIWVAKLEVLPSSTENPTALIEDLNVICSSGKLQITMNSVKESWEYISITDLLGRVSYLQKVRLLPGKNNIDVDCTFEQGIKVVTVGDAHAKIVIAN